MDGTREIVLSARLAPVVAGALHARLCELTAHGCDRLVLDLSGAGPLGREELGLLAGALAGQPPDCRMAVVVPDDVPAESALGDQVRVADSLTDARRALREPARRRGRAPAGPQVQPDHHALAVRQSLRWAALAAAEGDYDTALAWLSSAEAAAGSLPAEWRRRRQAWMLARQGALTSRVHHQLHPPSHRQGRA
jgi:hypothetical protein